MNKSFKWFSSIIVIVHLAIFLTPKKNFAQAPNTYKIGFIFDNLPENAPILLDILQHEIRSVVGQDANIEFPNSGIYINNLNLQTAKENFRAINENEDVNIIIAFGPINNVIITSAESHKKPTILFGTLASDFSRIDGKNQTSGIKNLSLILASYSVSEDLMIFKELIDYKKVGIVLEDYILELVPIRELLNGIFSKLDADYTIISFNEIVEIDEIKNQLVDIDAVYFTNTFYFTDQQIIELSEYMMEHKLPSYSGAGSKDVELGIMASSQTDDNLEQFFRRIALNVESIINGVNAGDLPTYLDTNTQLTLNFNTASKVGGLS